MLEKLLKELGKEHHVPFAEVRREFFKQYRIFKRLYPYADKEYSVRYVCWHLDRQYKNEKKYFDKGKNGNL